MAKLLIAVVFSVLLLVPVGLENVFANHPDLPCPPPGIPNIDPTIVSLNLGGASMFCYTDIMIVTVIDGNPITTCPTGYSPDQLFPATISLGIASLYACTAPPQQSPDPTHPDQCQGAAMLVNNHCFAQALSNIVGGELLSINTLPLLVGAIGVNPVITGLVGITIAGIVGQTAWFVHRKKRSQKS